MRIANPTIAALAILLPSVAFASDPPPVFILFVACPLILLASVSLLLSFATQKVGLIANGILAVIQMGVIAWDNVGYVSDAPGWFIAPIAINGVGLAIALLKNQPTSGRD